MRFMLCCFSFENSGEGRFLRVQALSKSGSSHLTNLELLRGWSEMAFFHRPDVLRDAGERDRWAQTTKKQKGLPPSTG
jgi:hypothetical protein